MTDIYEDYIFFKNMDSGGNDMYQADTRNISELITISNNDPKIVAFNTNGWMKHTVFPSLSSWTNYGSCGTYVKKIYAISHIEGIDPSQPDIFKDLVPVDVSTDKRKICIFCPDYTSIGGSEITIKTLYESLLVILDKTRYKIMITTNYQEVIEFNPTILITQQLCIKYALQLSEKYGYKVFILLHGPGQFSNHHPNCKLLIYNSTQLLESESPRVNPSIDKMVIHPAIQIDRIKYKIPSETRPYITFIGSSAYNCIKGSDLFVALAKLNPSQKFLHVSKYTKLDYDKDKYLNYMPISPPEPRSKKYEDVDPQSVDNLTLIDQTNDIASIYGKAKILIMPSLVESYGCVAVEACINGVPVVASNLPGIKEATYNKMIYVDDYRNVDKFNEALHEMLNNLDKYREESLSIEKLYKDDIEESLRVLKSKIEASFNPINIYLLE